MNDSHYEPITNAEGELCGFVQRPGPGPGLPLPLPERLPQVGGFDGAAYTAPGGPAVLRPGEWVVPRLTDAPAVRAALPGLAEARIDAKLRRLAGEQPPSPRWYSWYRDAFIGTGDPAYLAGMLAHVGPDTELPPKPGLYVESPGFSPALALMLAGALLAFAAVLCVLLAWLGVL